MDVMDTLEVSISEPMTSTIGGGYLKRLPLIGAAVDALSQPKLAPTGDNSIAMQNGPADCAIVKRNLEQGREGQ